MVLSILIKSESQIAKSALVRAGPGTAKVEAGCWTGRIKARIEARIGMVETGCWTGMIEAGCWSTEAWPASETSMAESKSLCLVTQVMT